MSRRRLISVLFLLNERIHAAMSNVYRLPRLALDSNFYGIEEACKLVNEYALDTALRFEPGSDSRDKLDDVMERYIRPSIHLLDCALRPANTGWLRRHELTMIELIVVHDAISNIMGFLASPSRNSSVSPTHATPCRTAVSFTRRWRGTPQRRLQRRAANIRCLQWWLPSRTRTPKRTGGRLRARKCASSDTVAYPAKPFSCLDDRPGLERGRRPNGLPVIPVIQHGANILGTRRLMVFLPSRDHFHRLLRFE